MIHHAPTNWMDVSEDAKKNSVLYIFLRFLVTVQYSSLCNSHITEPCTEGQGFLNGGPWATSGPPVNLVWLGTEIWPVKNYETFV